MAVQSYSFQIKTKGFSDVQDITPKVQELVSNSKCENGITTVFVPGSTAGITTIEFESGVVDDLKKTIERIAPQGIHYAHDARWGDGNGFAHVRAALIGPSLTIPLIRGELQLGTWQQIVLIDFDNRPRAREVNIQIIGE
ncbi:MAG TPA: secondary thiamine-phosphate synthase enzyme YjbQ [Bacteroidota bacterium]|nr:secondary thiamine-phosphate synthase enzyme YjbQ [Bacteroidota bacterium]